MDRLGQDTAAAPERVDADSSPTTTVPTVTRKVFLSTATAAAAGTALGAGLQGGPALASYARTHLPQVMRTGNPATLTYFYCANPGEAKLRQQLMNQFMAANPDIKIAPQICGAAGLQKLNTEIAGGSTPDLIMGFELTYGDYAKRGVLMDLQPLIKQDAEFQQTVMAQQIPAVIEMFSVGGHIWVLPEQITNAVLFYNKDHLRQAGLTMPTSWDDASWTWDKFLGYAKKLTQVRGSRISRYGYADMWSWPLVATNVLATANGQGWFANPVDPPPGSSNLADPRIVQAVQFYADLANVHKVAPTAQATTNTATTDLFMNGKVSMGVCGHWFYSAFASAAGLNFDIAPIPIGPHGGGHSWSNIGGTGIAISAKTKYPEQAWRWAKFWAGQQGQTAIAQSGLWTPVLQNVQRSAAFLKTHTKVANPALFTDVLQKGWVHSLPISRAWNYFVTDYVNGVVTDIYQNGKPAAQVLPGVDAKINAAIKKYR